MEADLYRVSGEGVQAWCTYNHGVLVVGPALQVGDGGDEGLLHIDGLDHAVVVGRGLDGEHEDVVLVVGRVRGALRLADLDQAAALGILVVRTPARRDKDDGALDETKR